MASERPTAPGYLDFAVSVTTEARTTIVEVRGDLDCYTAPRLRSVLFDLADGPRAVVLDVAGTDFIDSTGLGVLVGGLKRFRQQGGDMVVRSPNAMTVRLFEVTGVSKLFEIV
jgi:anti-sigma B factor antagonist